MPKHLTVDQLKDGLRQLRANGAVILEIEAVTNPVLIGGSPYKGAIIEKYYGANFILGANWEEFKRNQEERLNPPPTFRAKEHPWATYVDSCLVRNGEGTKEYLRLIQRERHYEEFFVDNEPVSGEVIREWLRPDAPAEYRNVYLGNVLYITWGGRKYTMKR